MDRKKLALLTLSYIIWGLVMFAFLKPRNEEKCQTYVEVAPTKVNESVAKIEDNNNKNVAGDNNNLPNNVDTPKQDHQDRIDHPKETFYYGKYKTPKRLLNISKARCLESELNVSYFETCFNKYKEYIEGKNYERAIEGLTKFMIEEPAVDIDPSCTPPALPDVKCEDYTDVFGNEVKKAEEEHKMCIIIQLGFDVDILEAYLWEVYDVVDKFFIIESTATHSIVRKPLIWERLKDTPRFKRFADKVVHFIIDEASIIDPKGNFWLPEERQERIRWTKFKEWNENNQFFKDDDLIGFGDTDEIPSRNTLAVLKQCSGNLGQVDIGTTFFFGHHEDVFKSDFPVRGFPYTLGDPTFFTLKDALEFRRGDKDFPSRMRGCSNKFLLGGAHISPYQYIPFLINKVMVATERRDPNIGEGNMEELEDYYKYDIKKNFINRINKPTEIMSSIKNHYYIPWIMECTPDRYPSFFGKRDQRLYYPPCFFNFEC